MRYVCSVCGYIYDEGREGVLFAVLPPSWKCPVCKAAKSAFVPEQKPQEAPKPIAAPVPAAVPPDEDMRELSPGVLAALCSNLARGCEKQYKEEEAALFRQLADYFTAAAPPQAEVDAAHLAALIQRDLEQGYPFVRETAETRRDRGTLRVCTWGEKVTNMLRSLLTQYQEEGEEMLRGTSIWVCTICGFLYVGDTPPEMCPVCKVPAWKFERVEGRDAG